MSEMWISITDFVPYFKDSMVPPSDRCRYKTDKAPTGPYNRKHLLDYLEQKAKEDKDWDEPVPYKKETRGLI
jgi:tropomodulin